MPSSSHSPDTDARAQLRRRLRQTRQRLPAAARAEASLHVAARLRSLPAFRKARCIALYYPVGAELDTTAIAVMARAAGKQLCLPVLPPGRQCRLRFVRYWPHTRFRRNRHGIPEPVPSGRRDIIRARDLDLVLVPLLGFDPAGNRLGSGAGWYDRSFDFRRRRTRPLLIGLAFDCQQLEALPAAAWDVPLDAVLTESALYTWRR